MSDGRLQKLMISSSHHLDPSSLPSRPDARNSMANFMDWAAAERIASTY